MCVKSDPQTLFITFKSFEITIRLMFHCLTNNSSISSVYNIHSCSDTNLFIRNPCTQHKENYPLYSTSRPIHNCFTAINFLIYPFPKILIFNSPKYHPKKPPTWHPNPQPSPSPAPSQPPVPSSPARPPPSSPSSKSPSPSLPSALS